MPGQARGGVGGWYVPVLALLALCVVFWRESLLRGKILIHGEVVHFDLVMMAQQARVLDPDPALLWNPSLFGGFPLFAEGQAAFAQPFKLALALLFDPTSAMMAYHFLAMFAGALGMLLLGREIGLSRLSAFFVSLAAAFSIVWIFFHNNMVCAGTLGFTPWVLLGVERWLRRPDAASVLWLAVPAALLVLSGYPHFAHGVAIHIACRLLVEACYRDGRLQARAQIGRLLGTGVAALLLALSLGAVQLLPLLELVGESHRSAGIDLLYPSSFLMHVRGLLFSFIGHYTDPSAPNLQGPGSAFVCALFLCGLAVCRDRRVVAHGVAGMVLYNLGIQELSPFFRMVYEYSLIPGIHAFRFMWAYVAISVIGIALVAGGAIDALAGRATARAPGGSGAGVLGIFSLLLAAIATGFLALWYHHAEYGELQLLFALLLAPACLLPLLLRRPAWLPWLATSLLLLECLAFRFDVFHFADPGVMAEPGQAQAVKADGANSGDYRIMDMTEASGFGFMPPDTPGIEDGLRGMLGSLTPMASLLWNLPSIDSVSSLGLHRRHLLYDITREEFFERSGTPGRRFIDVLGVRWITAGPKLPLVQATAIYREPGDWNVYRNGHALPRFQLYRSMRPFRSPEEVLQHWGERAADEVFIEAPRTLVLRATGAPLQSTAASLAILERSSSRSEVRVESAGGIWLFMADANYPGWQASIDGSPVVLYSAQVLGKALEVPAGRHRVVFEYVPRRFRIGLAMSLLGVVIALAVLSLHWFRALPAARVLAAKGGQS